MRKWEIGSEISLVRGVKENYSEGGYYESITLANNRTFVIFF